MASSAKDIQLRELKDTVSQLKTMIAEQTELNKALRLIIDEKSSHEKVLQEQVDYLTKKRKRQVFLRIFKSSDFPYNCN